MVSDLQGVAGRKSAALAMNQTQKGERPAGRNSFRGGEIRLESEWNFHLHGDKNPHLRHNRRRLWREVPFAASQHVPNA